jgi:integrase
MAIHLLKPGFVDKVTVPGMYSDGGGLYLQVRGKGGSAKSWIFRYDGTRFRKSRSEYIGLGPVHTVTLKEARERAQQCRLQIHDGIDPKDARERNRLAMQAEAAKQVSFAVCAEDYIAFKRKTRSLGTARNAAYAVRLYLNPKLATIPVSEIETDQVYEAIKPIWERVPVTGNFVRAHLEGILDRAKAKGYRSGDNPASMKKGSPLSLLLPAVSEVHITIHRPSLHYRDIGKFMAYELRAYKSPNLAHGISVRRELLEFLILTAVRTDEARHMQWREIDWENRLWTCPWQRTKTGKKTKKAHIVPLSEPALAVLRRLQTKQRELGLEFDNVFAHLPPNTQWLVNLRRRAGVQELAGNVINEHALRQFLHESLGRRGLSVHGFRTSFSSWANELGFAHRDIETALDHVVSRTGPEEGAERISQVARIYNRDTERLEPRRKLLEAWGDHCNQIEPPAADVIPLKRKAADV